MKEQCARDDIDNFGHFHRAGAQDFFYAKTGMSHKENCRFNMSPLHCPVVCADL